MCPSAWEPERGDRCLNKERCARVMKAICHTLLAELSYILLSEKEIETANTERTANETLFLQNTNLLICVLNKYLLM